ncbi:MAG: hypothetical protein ACYTCU_09690 [Planctomycetota bacterium]|jgi:hypothetical protein
MSDPDITRRDHRAAGFVLVLALLVVHIAWPLSPGEQPARGASTLIELILPGIYSDARDTSPPVLGVPHPPEGRNLATRLFLEQDAPPSRGALYAGLLPLLLGVLGVLALLGFAVTPRPRSWRPRGLQLVLVVLLLVVAFTNSSPSAFLARAPVVLLIVGSGVGLALLADERIGAGTPALVLGTVTVLLAAVLGALALKTGSVPDVDVTAPLTERLPPGGVLDWSPTMLAANGAHLRAVIDRSALAAFASMTALLLHLKGRKRWTLVLLVAVVVADVLSARLA